MRPSPQTASSMGAVRPGAHFSHATFVPRQSCPTARTALLSELALSPNVSVQPHNRGTESKIEQPDHETATRFPGHERPPHNRPLWRVFHE